MRKGLIYWLAILLAVLPLLVSFSKEAAAASTRVAVIKELKGTVKVKKAGGSKEFTAFAKMSLNEGDVLAAGSGGSAVLQFANGTSEDDKMTVASNTKLTFSKLSNKKGTTTKVSMWSGSAWVDVKSITNKEDQFTLETPTAVMGVRGTHLLVTVNPDTGATNLMVAAGVVQTTPTAGGGQSQNVYPTQNALITKDGTDGSDVTIAPADLETLMQQGDAEIVKAIIQGAKDITAENEQYVQRYESGEVPKEIGGTNADLERFKNNTQNLLGALVTQAVQLGLITQERMNQLIEEAGNQTGFKVDVTKSSLQLTEAEKAKQEVQRKKEEALAKREAERKAKEEAERKKLEDTIRKLEEERKAKEKAAQEAMEAKKKQAQEKYEGQLSPEEKKNFNKRQEETKAAQNSASPSPSPSPSSGSSSGPGPGPVLSSNANLSGLRVSLPGSSENLIVFNGAANTYTITVPNTTGSVVVKPTLEQTNASVVVKGEQLIGGEANIALLSSGTSAGTTTSIPVVVTAQNGTTKKTYTLIVNREASLLTAPITIQGADGFVFKPDQGTYTLNPVSSDTTVLTLDFGEIASGVFVFVTNNDEPIFSENSVYDVPLAKGSNQIIINVSSGGFGYVASLAGIEQLGILTSSLVPSQTYTINVVREATPEYVTSWSVKEWLGGSAPKFISEEFGEGYIYRSSVAVPVDTDSIHLNMLLDNRESSPDYVHIWSNGEELATYDADEGEDIVISDLELQLDPENTYTTFDIEYSVNGLWWYSAELIVLRGEPKAEDYEIGVSIYADSTSMNVNPSGDFSLFAFARPNSASSSKFTIWPHNDYSRVYQWVDGVKVELLPGEEWGQIANLPQNETWYDFEIDNVWDKSMQRSRNAALHIFKGSEIPLPFKSLKFEASANPAIGAASDDPSTWYVEVPEGTGEALIKPIAIPNNVVLKEVQSFIDYQYNKVVPDNVGYYHLPTFGELLFTFESGGRQFVYSVHAITEMPFSLNNVIVNDVTGDQSEVFDVVEFLDHEFTKSLTIPYSISQLSLKPYINNDYYNIRVSVDGVALTATYENYSWRRSTTNSFPVGTGKSVVIEIASPSGYTKKTYTLNLERPDAEGELSSLNLTTDSVQSAVYLDYGTPIALGDNQYFANYRGNEVNLTLDVQKGLGSGDVLVYLDEDLDPLTGDDSKYELNHLTEGWHWARIFINDSTNSGEPARYKLWIYVGEQPPSDFGFNGIQAQDSTDSPAEFFQQDASDPFKWTTEVVPGIALIGKELDGGNEDARVVKVVFSNGIVADDDLNMYRIYLEEDGSTDAQMWVKYGEVTFVYRLQINSSSNKPPHVTALSSAVITSNSPVVWAYSEEGTKQFAASVDLMGEEGITINMVPTDGYQINYSANNGLFDSLTGRWTGLSLGLNTLTVTVTHGDWSDEYTFKLNVSDSSSS